MQHNFLYSKIVIYCISMLFLHTESTDSMIRNIIIHIHITDVVLESGCSYLILLS